MLRQNRVLFICGSLHQTSMMHQIAKCLPECECHFTPYYGDAVLEAIAKAGWLEFSIMGERHRRRAAEYLQSFGLTVDEGGRRREYDLVVTCSDLVVPKNIRKKKILLVQEGMTDPENAMYYLVKWCKLPRYLASTAATGLSLRYERFCVASEGYKDFFIKKGIPPAKIAVTGIPNFDNAQQYLQNNFPHRHYVLAATSDARETFKRDNRPKFIQHCLEIAQGRQLIFKLHPNEDAARATSEILALAPHALVFHEGNTNHMIANCDVLITQYSTVVYTGLALGKEVHSYFDVHLLKKMMPVQNGGTSARNIAGVCRELMLPGTVSSAPAQTHFPPLRKEVFAT